MHGLIQCIMHSSTFFLLTQFYIHICCINLLENVLYHEFTLYKIYSFKTCPNLLSVLWHQIKIII